MKQKGRIGAVILAGGRGSRMGGRIQKQYMLLADRPMICYALEVFEHSQVDDLVLVTGRGEAEFVRREILADRNFKKLRTIVPGGAERYHSVYEGLKALEGCSHVLIHDGARPLVTEEIIERAIAGAKRYGACVVGMPVKDTIKVADDNGFAASTPDRSHLWQIQTPQAFSYDLIRSAYDRVMADEELQAGITDDAMVAETALGTSIRLIEGSYENLKITTPEDLTLAEALLKRRQPGVLFGAGMDDRQDKDGK